MSTLGVRAKSGPALWILNHYAITPDMPGGTRHYDLARHLVAKGYDVTIIASSFHHMTHRETRFDHRRNWELEEVNGVKFLWLRTPPYTGNNWRRVANMLTYMVRSYHYGKRLPHLDPRVPRPDVVIGSTVHLLAVLSAYRLARHYDAHFIMEVRDLWPQTPVEMGRLSRHSPLTWGLRLLEKSLYHRAEKILILLPNAGAYITSLGVPTDKLLWIPNGTDALFFEVVDSLPKHTDAFIIMYAGTHGQANAMDVLVRAAEVLQKSGDSSVRFISVGDGPEKPALIALKNKLGLRNLEFRDPVPQKAIPSVLAEADACVVAVRDLALYDFGTSLNKFFTYMAAGKPVLLSGNLSSNIIQEASCGLTVAAEDPAALAEGALCLSRMPPAEREAMGLRGREYVRLHHDWSILAEQLHQCLQNLLSDKASPSAARS